MDSNKLFILCSLLSLASLLRATETIEVAATIPESAQPLTPVEIPEDQEFDIYLKDPVFSGGVIKTDQGGIVTSKDLRIQAQSIEYTNRVENGRLIKKIVAEGDLLFQHGPHAFAGRRLEYDFVSKTGTLYDGVTFTGVWFLGGEKIQLNNNGSYVLYNAYITTSESKDRSWDIQAKAVQITKEHLLSAKNIRFRFIKLPIFYIPSFKMNLQMFSDPPVRYKVRWDKGLGPRLTMRYRVFSWEDLNVFFRLDYRLKRGPGAAIESEYYSKDKRTILLTKNYGAYDKTVPTEKGPRRYRLQGLYQWHSQKGNTQAFGSYDKLSDDRMPNDFKSDDFEINTQKRTIFRFNHQEENSLSSFIFQPRINSFQSLNKQLPLAVASLRPFTLGNSGILCDNYFSGGYLDYVYNRQIQELLPHIHAGRFETRNNLYRPISLNYATLTPSAGFIGLYYTNRPGHHHGHGVGQAIFTYGAHLSSYLYRNFLKTKHQIEPYIDYLGLTHPTTSNHNHFIFGLEDGYAQLNQLKVGIKNSLFRKGQTSFAPTWSFDLYTYSFFGETAFHYTVPKYYLDIGWNRSNLAIRGGVSWNQQQRVFDYSNLLTEWTINENVALVIEFRHRSRFDWRKAYHHNFILDVDRPIEELLHTPISDQRNTLLTRLQMRLSPKWTCHFESHTGWARDTEPHYNEYKIELFTLLATSWLLKISYKYSPNDWSIAPSLSLVK